MFPGFRLSLPPKRWFKDNYDSDFLEDRQLGLQAFLQNLVAHKDISNRYRMQLFKGVVVARGGGGTVKMLWKSQQRKGTADGKIHCKHIL